MCICTASAEVILADADFGPPILSGPIQKPPDLSGDESLADTL